MGWIVWQLVKQHYNIKAATKKISEKLSFKKKSQVRLTVF
jgi:hypothetical protein